MFVVFGVLTIVFVSTINGSTKENVSRPPGLHNVVMSHNWRSPRKFIEQTFTTAKKRFYFISLSFKTNCVLCLDKFK